ncbi:MAG: ABC transporter permease [Clostridia bacterium]|nr:ABC transporter permease [Clostridia bacterium]
MRAWRRVFIFLAGVVLYLGALDVVLKWFADMPERIELNAADYALSAGEGMTIGDLNQMDDRMISFEKTVKAGALSIVVTNGNYAQFGEIDMIRGSFFGDLSSTIGQNVAVISDTLAFSELKTLNAVGAELDLYGHCYTVCGVYQSNGVLDSLGGDGSERVYIPASSGFDREYAGDTGIQRILIQTQPEDTAFTGRQLYSEWLRVSPNAKNYILRDYVHANRLVLQTKQWFLFALGAAAALCLLRMAYGRIALGVHALGAAKRSGGLRAPEKRRLIGQIAMAAILAAAACLILRAAYVDVYLPNGLLPDDTLMNGAYYKALLLERIQESNVYTAYKAPGYERLFWCEMAVKAFSFFASWMAFFRCMAVFDLKSV